MDQTKLLRRAKNRAHEIVRLESEGEVEFDRLESARKDTTHKDGGKYSEISLIELLAHNIIAAAAYSIGVCNEQ